MPHGSFFIDPYVISIELREQKQDASEPSIDFRPCQEPRGGNAPMGVNRHSGSDTVQPTAAQQPHKEEKMAYPRAVILRHVVGMLGQEDELHTDDSLRGLTATWLPGDHGLTILVGGGNDTKGKLMEPALSVFVHALSAPRLLALVNDLTLPNPTVGPPPPLSAEPWEDLPPKIPRGHYDPRKDPFRLEPTGAAWHRRVRCSILAQGPQFYWPFAVDDDAPLYLDEDPELPSGGWGVITTYEIDQEDPFRNTLGKRTRVLDFHVAGRVRVHITQEEASELVAVLRHQPDWAQG